MRLSSEILARNLAPRGTTFFCPSLANTSKNWPWQQSLRVCRSTKHTRLAPWHVGGSRIAIILHISMKRETKPTKCCPAKSLESRELRQTTRRQLVTYLLSPPFPSPTFSELIDADVSRYFARQFRVITQSRYRIRGQRVNLIVAMERKICLSLSRDPNRSKLPSAITSIACSRVLRCYTYQTTSSKNRDLLASSTCLLNFLFRSRIEPDLRYAIHITSIFFVI